MWGKYIEPIKAIGQTRSITGPPEHPVRAKWTRENGARDCTHKGQRFSAQIGLTWRARWGSLVEEIMVSFTCNACGQTVRKNQVEKHYQSNCPNCEVLSCIDCGKDFYGEEYSTHTSCISEAEKYQGKLYKPKDKQNKGEHKQQEWIKVF